METIDICTNILYRNQLFPLDLGEYFHSFDEICYDVS